MPNVAFHTEPLLPHLPSTWRLLSKGGDADNHLSSHPDCPYHFYYKSLCQPRNLPFFLTSPKQRLSSAMERLYYVFTVTKDRYCISKQPAQTTKKMVRLTALCMTHLRVFL